MNLARFEWLSDQRQNRFKRLWIQNLNLRSVTWNHFRFKLWSWNNRLKRLQELDRRYRLTESSNAEIAHAWFRLALASGYPGLESALQRAKMRSVPDRIEREDRTFHERVARTFLVQRHRHMECRVLALSDQAVRVRLVPLL